MVETIAKPKIREVLPVEPGKQSRLKNLEKGRVGGKRAGAGRPPKMKEPSILTQAYALIDKAQIPAIKTVVALLSKGKPEVRLRAANILLNKRIADVTDQSPIQKPTQIMVIHNYRTAKVSNGSS